MISFTANIQVEGFDLGTINLQALCDIIILISAVLIAAQTIFKFLKKPVDDLKQSARDDEEKHVEEILKREMPSLLAENCKTIMSSLDELKDMTMGQEAQLDEIQTSIDLLNESQLDMMRYNMNKIYYKYRPYKKILSADKKAFIKIYNDYKTMNGNTWIDSLYSELKDWPIVEEEQELHQ